ncbi:MAG: DNA-processing protein DprA [Planctomycetaceae bacterium]
MRDFPEELVCSVAITLAYGVGPRIQTDLIAAFGSASNVLRQSADALMQVNGVGPKTAAALVDCDLKSRATELLEECGRLDVDVMLRDSEDYPERLREICDPPAILYRRGVLLPQDDLAIAIVGSRRCSTYGRRHAERLAGQLAQAGFTVVSGLARGIDLAAHQGAMNAAGRTIAVLAGGVRDIYPPEHDQLAAEITQQGALLSEMPLDQRILPGLFPQRNRIISGLCLGVVVVEATRNSGALYTARHAQEQGREVFALPGPVDSLASAGCHDLIRDGVTLIRHVDDILEALGPLPVPARPGPGITVHSPRELSLNAVESRILNLIGSHPVAIDELLSSRTEEASQVLATLTVLEMKRMIRRLPGNTVVRYD